MEGGRREGGMTGGWINGWKEGDTWEVGTVRGTRVALRIERRKEKGKMK